MYLGEALAILGLDGDDELTQNGVKRTYLKKLKDHPPERDPDGFQRLREAYELVREFADGERAAPVFVPAPAEPLWDPPPAAVEPEPEPEPPQPPPPVATQPPATMIVEEAPELPLDERVASVLNLLQHDELDAANELAAAWREADDHKKRSQDGLVTWALVRELLGVAQVLPAPVVRQLARGIAGGDMREPKQALAQFQRQQPFEAAEANTVLIKRASSLHSMIGGALASRPQPVQSSYVPPQPRSSGGAGKFAWVGAMVVLALIRFMAAGSHSSSSSYDYTPPHIDIDPKLYQPMPELPNFTPPLPPPPRDFDPSADLQTLRTEVYLSLAALRTFGNAAELQVDAELLEGAFDRNDCDAVRMHSLTIAGLPASDDPERARSVALHFAAIKQRLDKLCPDKPVKKKKRSR